MKPSRAKHWRTCHTQRHSQNSLTLIDYVRYLLTVVSKGMKGTPDKACKYRTNVQRPNVSRNQCLDCLDTEFGIYSKDSVCLETTFLTALLKLERMKETKMS